MANAVNPHSFDWDDSELIAAYDKAMEKVTRRYHSKKPLSSAMNGESAPEQNGVNGSEHEWAIGDYCRCLYSEDGILYEAEISEIYEDDGMCLVQYLGYNNEEEVPLKSLKPSSGKHARKLQRDAARAENWSKGDFCRAVYSKDGRMYEAVVEEVGEETCVVKFIGYNDVETVALTDMQSSKGPIARFDQDRDIGKKREPEVKNSGEPPKSPKPESSEYSSSDEMSSASNAGQDEHVTVEVSVEEVEEPVRPRTARPPNSRRHHSHARPELRATPNLRRLAPPPLPVSSCHNGCYSAETLPAMLMSWYMAGYHTGYHEGRIAGRASCNCEDESCRREHRMRH